MRLALPPRLIFSSDDRLGSAFIISFLSKVLLVDQLEISSMVLKQPVQIFSCGLIIQIFMHGEPTSLLFQIFLFILALNSF